MIQTPYPVENELGLSWYMTDQPGIGGVLRSNPEDFHVEEISTHQYTDGKYLICKLTKRNWDQQRAVKEIAKRLHISAKRIGFSGTKDKSAVTTQYISLYDVTYEAVNSLFITDMQITPCGYMQRPLSLGELDGNRFHITVRDLAYTDDDTKELMAHIDNISSGARSGIPNYFGIQRFGVKRPITHKVGFEILKQNYEEAVAVFVGEASSYELQETQDARRDYYTSRDPKAALRDLPMQLSLERSILYHLEKHPTEYLEALCVLPKTLRSMFVGAVQSWFFNLTLSARLADGRGLLPGVGDRVLLTDGRFDVVSKRTQPMVMTQIKRGRIEPALFMPGSLEYSVEGRDDEVMADLMRNHGFDSAAFKEASRAIGMPFDGAVRSTLLTADVTATLCEKAEKKPDITNSLHLPDESHPDTQAVTFSFALGPGKYATTVLREYMKTDPLHMA